jgi:hypothetical protein
MDSEDIDAGFGPITEINTSLEKTKLDQSGMLEQIIEDTAKENYSNSSS